MLTAVINQSSIREYLYKYRYYISIAAAVALITRRIYHSLFTPPKNLQHIPKISYLQQLLVLIRKEPVEKKTERLVFPLLNKSKNKLYLVSDIYYYLFVLV